jgi:hypothetical protein
MEEGFIALESRMEGDPLIHPCRVRISSHGYDEVAADRLVTTLFGGSEAETRRSRSGGWSGSEASRRAAARPEVGRNGSMPCPMRAVTSGAQPPT